MHDERVDRTTDGTGKIADLTLAQLKALRLRQDEGGPTAAITDERVQTLDELLALAKDRIVTSEQVIERAPEVIIGSWCGKPVRRERIASRPGWSTVPAVRDGRIFEVKSTYILQPGPAALTDGVSQLEAILRSCAE